MNDQYEPVNSSKILHFGCLIYLKFVSDESKHYMSYSEGYNKMKIRLTADTYLDNKGQSTLGLFKVLPGFFSAEYEKIEQKFDNKQMLQELTALEKRQKKQELPKQIKNMDDEIALNIEQMKKMKGSPIKFGQTVQFLHYASSKFLHYDLNHVSDFESDNLRVALNQVFSSETCWKILPCFTYQSESSGLIFEGDSVYIVSIVDQSKKVFGVPYLHASKPKEKNKKAFTYSQYEIKEDQSLISNPKSINNQSQKSLKNLEDKNIDKREMNISTEKKSK